MEIGRGEEGFLVRARRGDRMVLIAPQGLEPVSSAPLAVLLTIAGVLVLLPLDPARIRLLARNLIKNALRDTPTGGAPPVVASHLVQDHWTISVTDQGPGVAPEHLERLTQAFYRADLSRGRASGGFGLGLYLRRAIAEAHAGPWKSRAVQERAPASRWIYRCQSSLD